METLKNEVWRGRLSQANCSNMPDCNRFEECSDCRVDKTTYALVKLPEEDSAEKILMDLAGLVCTGHKCGDCPNSHIEVNDMCPKVRARIILREGK